MASFHKAGSQNINEFPFVEQRFAVRIIKVAQPAYEVTSQTTEMQQI